MLQILMISSGMDLFAGQNEAAEALLAAKRVNAAGEAAQVAAQNVEEALREVGGAQAVQPAQVSENAVEFGLEFLLIWPEPKTAIGGSNSRAGHCRI